MPAKPNSADDDSNGSRSIRSDSSDGLELNDKLASHHTQRTETIADCVRDTVARFLDDLNGEEVTDLYNLVIEQVEKPLIEVVMQHTLDNQSKASKLLGINRNTLRKKLMVHQDKGS